jgi:uncharacterized membrane protein required for colicin V production
VYINLMLAVVFVACLASLLNNGLWSNIILLLNVITAGLVAMNFYEPLSDLFISFFPTWGAAFDFIAVWVLFVGALAVSGTVTDFLSRTKVRFLKPVDQYGGIAVACWVGWVMVCFTTVTLHMAPLPRSFAGGDFQPTNTTRMFFGLAPDHQWLGFVQKMSRDGWAYCCWRENRFDPRAEFIYKYAQRRLGLEKGGSWAVGEKKPGAAAPAAEPAKP